MHDGCKESVVNCKLMEVFLLSLSKKGTNTQDDGLHVSVRVHCEKDREGDVMFLAIFRHPSKHHVQACSSTRICKPACVVVGIRFLVLLGYPLLPFLPHSYYISLLLPFCPHHDCQDSTSAGGLPFPCGCLCGTLVGAPPTTSGSQGKSV